MRKQTRVFVLVIALFLSAVAGIADAATKSILYFNDYSVGEDRMHQALRYLGDQYTVIRVSSSAEFKAEIETGNFDLGIIMVQNHYSFYFDDGIRALGAFVEGGGKSIYTDFNLDPNYAALFGATWGYPTPHSAIIVQNPLTSHIVDPLPLINAGWYVYSMDVSGDTIGAVFEDNSGAIAIGNQGHSITNGFLTDSVGVEGIQLFVNEIQFLLGESSEEVVFASIEGRVVDADSGSALPNLYLHLYRYASDGLTYWLDYRYTDSSGAFKFDLLGPGSYYIEIHNWNDNYIMKTGTFVLQKGQALILEDIAVASTSISGHVIDADTNTPLSNYYIDLVRYAEDGQLYWVDYRYTNENGEFKFDLLGAGKYIVQVYGLYGNYLMRTSDIEIAEGQDLVLEDIAIDSTSISGRVIDADNNAPLSNYFLYLFHYDENGAPYLVTTQSSDVDGSFKFYTLSAGSYYVEVFSPSNDYLMRTSDIELAEGQDLVLEDIAIDSTSISGRVIDAATGIPLPYRYVYLYQYDASGWPNWVGFRYSDDNGLFKFFCSTAGKFYVEVQDPYYQYDTKRTNDFVVEEGQDLILEDIALQPVTPFSIDLKINSSGAFDPKTMIATLNGTATCSTIGYISVSGTLKQKVGRMIISGSYSTALWCEGEVSWSAQVTSFNGVFAGGFADTYVEASGCGENWYSGCDQESLQTSIKLKSAKAH